MSFVEIMEVMWIDKDFIDIFCIRVSFQTSKAWTVCNIISLKNYNRYQLITKALEKIENQSNTVHCTVSR